MSGSARHEKGRGSHRAQAEAPGGQARLARAGDLPLRRRHLMVRCGAGREGSRQAQDLPQPRLDHRDGSSGGRDAARAGSRAGNQVGPLTSRQESTGSGNVLECGPFSGPPWWPVCLPGIASEGPVARPRPTSGRAAAVPNPQITWRLPRTSLQRRRCYPVAPISPVGQRQARESRRPPYRRPAACEMVESWLCGA